MRTIRLFCLGFLPLLLTAQVSEADPEALVDLQFKLMEARINLLQAKIKAIENGSDESLKQAEKVKIVAEKAIEDTSKPRQFHTAIMINPNRLFEGTFLLSYERTINTQFAINISGMGTYLTNTGFGSSYLKSQSFAAYSFSSEAYEPISGKMITGWGVIGQMKYYLSAKQNPKTKAPLGFYAAPQLMYRKIWITGEFTDYSNFDLGPYEQREVVQILDVASLGTVLGGKFALFKVFCVDLYVGGLLRLSKYSREDTFTRYKSWRNIDYSGVLPTAGINLGILN